MKSILTLLALCITIATAQYSDQGVMEAGGRFSFASIDYNAPGDSRGHHVVVRPQFNWYFTDNVYLAGKFHIESQSGGSFFGIGAGVGYAFPADAAIIPYAEAGLELIHSGWVDKMGLAIPVHGGIKIPLFRHVAADVGAYAYPKFINDNPGVDFGIAGGITVFIF